MIVDLVVPFADTGVTDLRFVLTAPQLPILDSLEIPDIAPGCDLSLRLLGASHQAIVTTPHGDYAETLACLPQLGPAPPRPTQVDLADRRFQFDVHIAQHDDTSFAHHCAAELAAGADTEHALIGRFPGHPHALTSLRVINNGPHHWGWRTVHAYPQSGTWVRSTTLVTPRGARDMSTALLPSD
jgi:hypothetical protein